MPNKHPPIPEEFQTPKAAIEAHHKNVVRYLTSMSMVTEMYEKGIIDSADYAKCEQLMADKYSLPDNSIYRRRGPDAP